MHNVAQTAVSALVTGSVASVISALALAAMARSEGRSAFQPINATSHWLHGDRAGDQRAPDLAHTALGYTTHHASAIFWAVPFEAWLATQPPRSGVGLLRDAAALSAVAAVVDYGIAPKRLTPGWELAVSKRSMFGAFASLAVGLAAGALISRQLRGG